MPENPAPAAGPAAGFARDYAEVSGIRAFEPERIGQVLRARRRRERVLPADGRLMVVAADHPARGANGVGDRPMAMASRTELLDRLRVALADPGVDGLLGSADIVEDLALLGALEGKVVFGSMNRGGLQGASFELDDRFTGYDAQAVADANLDGGKLLTRIALDDAGTLPTLTASAEAVSELAARRLIAMVEPFWSRWVDGRVVHDLSADGVVKSVNVAQALGRTTAYTWLKLPVVDDMERVMEATTLPTVLLGGDPSTSPEETFATWRKALSLPSVRGLTVGRTLLYPPDDDVAGAVRTAASLVH
ncbi:Cgl0159 family (beta/alpha)8-fold protein [Kineococcus indalonis]|uniref:Cgl0159 family (beta/alpha)8-fold protein n=1 Tax=Kineococcus indalonis TaxID=2696566 RepID=UPI001411D9E7|nr:deoxyribose-phosphate aldolase [Kineococcus indalonis]NAZ85492.1 deoxyribose-phosphate aldolase [Kineococcus indalonis]